MLQADESGEEALHTQALAAFDALVEDMTRSDLLELPPGAPYLHMSPAVLLRGALRTSGTAVEAGVTNRGAQLARLRCDVSVCMLSGAKSASRPATGALPAHVACRAAAWRAAHQRHRSGGRHDQSRCASGPTMTWRCT